MVKLQARLDATFAALADPTRRAMVARLARGEASVGQLARPFDMSAPAISKHLRVLERAGLLRQKREGRVRRCRLEPKPLHAAAAWIEQHRKYWTDQLDALATFLESPLPAQRAPVRPEGRRPGGPKPRRESAIREEQK